MNSISLCKRRKRQWQQTIYLLVYDFITSCWTPATIDRGLLQHPIFLLYFLLHFGQMFSVYICTIYDQNLKKHFLIKMHKNQNMNYSLCWTWSLTPCSQPSGPEKNSFVGVSVSIEYDFLHFSTTSFGDAAAVHTLCLLQNDSTSDDCRSHSKNLYLFSAIRLSNICWPTDLEIQNQFRIKIQSWVKMITYFKSLSIFWKLPETDDAYQPVVSLLRHLDLTRKILIENLKQISAYNKQKHIINQQNRLQMVFGTIHIFTMGRYQSKIVLYY